MGAKKLNSMRFLEQQGVPYEVVEYSAEIHDAAELAEVVGVPCEMVYKSLVVDSGTPGKPWLALVAADRRLDLKKLALAAGVKKLSMASHADAEAWTGLLTGGISPLALMGKNWRVFIDQPVTTLQQFMLNAGQRGLNLRVPVTDFLRVTRATVAEISAPAED
ncbi:MAG: aminoacyl-tRNA deacylase [Anaerolineae bacterium]|nr:aminoacyl-tRNA deacylase [Anaerolineae bacterium]